MKFSTNWLLYQELELLTPEDLELACKKWTLRSYLMHLWQAFVNSMTEPFEVKVWETCDQDGTVWWNAYDPITKQTLHQLSEAEIRSWIEQRYYQHDH